MMFETFGVTGLFTSEQPVLAMYGVGKVTGLCVDVGAEKIGPLSAAPNRSVASLITAASAPSLHPPLPKST